ncbi:MAG: hypothetical protein KAS04_06665, partial [Candidatus Aenigmarchaeota archaeon]|nr:hypothetical protein [Candidatus Aenigmarchaeota archaeon]
YHSDKYQYRSLEEWSCDLHRSFTGKRLLRMIPDNCEHKVINSTPEIGDNAKSMLEPEHEYIKKHIGLFDPKLIVACGKVAQKACEEIGIDYFGIPHPAWRHLSIDMEVKIKSDIKGMLA